ncbi:hypothetical protein E2320_001615, partial [Naja naja]
KWLGALDRAEGLSILAEYRMLLCHWCELHGLEGTADGGEGRAALVRLDCLSGPALCCHQLNLCPTLGPASAHDKGTCHFQASPAGGWVSR